MAELRFSSGMEPRNVVGDWAIRIGVALCFIAFGWEKFPTAPGSQWVRMFHDIGWGDWFRYFTGTVEVLGGLLVLIPRTALAGLILLVLIMGGAVIIVAFVLERPADALFPGMFLAALVGASFWISRNR